MTTIVDFSDLKVILELNKTSYADYPALELMANQVHDALENYTGRRLGGIEKQTETGFLANSSNIVDLRNIPLSSVSSIVVDDNAITNFKIEAYGIRAFVALSGMWTIVSKGGFKTIPPDIYKAEMNQIVYEYQNKEHLGSKVSSNDSGSISNDGLVILPEVKRLLAKYKHVSQTGF